MPDGLNEPTSRANFNSAKSIWHQKGLLTITNITQETKNQFPGIKQTLPLTYTYKMP